MKRRAELPVRAQPSAGSRTAASSPASLGGWRFTRELHRQFGIAPRRSTVRGASRDIASGVNGALRADYNGEPIGDRRSRRSISYFNTDAFSIPAAGAFGTSPRNIIIGPGSKNLNVQRATATVQLGGNRNRLDPDHRSTNMLNLANYTGVDTNVNSPTFGQVRASAASRSATLNLRFRF